MPKRSGIIEQGAMLLLLALTGCAHVHVHDERGSCCRPLPDDAPPLTALRDVARGEIRPDLSRVPPFPALEESIRREWSGSSPYRELTTRDCQCIAVRSSSLGNLLDQKASGCLAQTGGAGPRRGDEPHPSTIVQEGMLRDAALEARNRSAGAALELFYRLVEAEGKFDVLKQSLAEIEDALASGERMKAKGMQLGDDFEILRRRRVAILDSSIELGLAIGRLNAELQHLLKLAPPDDTWRIWPVADLSVVADPIDVRAAVAVALEHRSDLVALRRLGPSLDHENAPLVRTVLGQVHALLELSCREDVSGWKALLTLLKGPQASDQEVQELCRQLHAYRIERELAVADEIRQDVLTVEARLRQVAVAREEVQSWDRRLDELKAKEERGMSTFPERTTVQLRRFEAQGALIEKVVAWNLARIQMAQHQGILVEGCGPAACPLPVPVPDHPG